MAEIILFEHTGFRGPHTHLYESVSSVMGRMLNDEISSFVITSGNWQFFRDTDFNGPASDVFGPGLYNWVETFGIPNDSISSVQLVT